MRRTWSDGRRLRKDQGGYQWMYNTVQWRRRRLHQLRKYPLCAACLQDNHVKAATVVHHLEDHKGDWRLFISSPVESSASSATTTFGRTLKSWGISVGAIFSELRTKRSRSTSTKTKGGLV